jgi:AcrR family transcriptional regulator
MANINLQRRAEIGREKSARTRAQLIAAAHSLFARQPVESITVDDVVKEADVAKGTFYVHFQDLRGLTTAAAAELVKTFDELLQPARCHLTTRFSGLLLAAMPSLKKPWMTRHGLLLQLGWRPPLQR